MVFDLIQLRVVLESIDDAVLLLDENRRILFSNDAASRLAGLDAGDGTGAGYPKAKTFMDRFALRFPNGAEVPGAERPLAKLLRGEQFSDLELRARRKDDGREWVLRYGGRPLQMGGESGAPFVLTITDITDAREAEGLFEAAFRASPTPTVVARLADLQLVMVNDSFAELTDYGHDGLVGQTVTELGLIVQSGRLEAALQALRQGEQVTLRDLDLRTRHGAKRHTLAAGTPITCRREACVLATFVDVTPHHVLQSTVRQATKDLLQETAWFSQTLSQRLQDLSAGVGYGEERPKLTDRERQVLSRIAEGDTNERIATALGLSHQTVRNYVHRIYGKIGVSSRAEAVVWAREHRS